MLTQLFGLEYARKRALRKCPPGPLHDYLERPFLDPASSCRDAGIVAVDMETTGLDPKKDAILSIGMVDIVELSIKLNTSWHTIVSVDRDLPAETVAIHQITDDEALFAGRPPHEVIPLVLERLAGKAMLVHFRHIEHKFLDTACRELYGAPFLCPTIDTLVLGQRVFERMNHSIQATDLRLFNLRTRYNLPRYRAHNALNDALATAELFLAMSADMAPPDDCHIRQFLT